MSKSLSDKDTALAEVAKTRYETATKLDELTKSLTSKDEEIATLTKRADHILSLARTERESLGGPHGADPLCLEIAKNRHGAMGSIPLSRDWKTLLVTELELADSGDRVVQS